MFRFTPIRLPLGLKDVSIIAVEIIIPFYKLLTNLQLICNYFLFTALGETEDPQEE